MSDFKLLKSIDNKLSESESDLQLGSSTESRLQSLVYNFDEELAVDPGIGGIPQPSYSLSWPQTGQQSNSAHWIFSTDNGDSQDVEVVGYSVARVRVVQSVTLTGQASVALPLQFAHFEQFKIAGRAVGTISLSLEDNQVAGVPVDADETVGVLGPNFALATSHYMGAFGDESVTLKSCSVYHQASNPVEVVVCNRAMDSAGPSGIRPIGTYSFTVEAGKFTDVDLSHVPSLKSADGNPFFVFLIARELGGPSANPRLHLEFSGLISR